MAMFDGDEVDWSVTTAIAVDTTLGFDDSASAVHKAVNYTRMPVAIYVLQLLAFPEHFVSIKNCKHGPSMFRATTRYHTHMLHAVSEHHLQRESEVLSETDLCPRLLFYVVSRAVALCTSIVQ